MTRSTARQAATRLARHSGTSPEEAAAARAAIERLDAAAADPTRQRRPAKRVAGKVTTAACQFPDPYDDELRAGHPFTYVRFTRPRKFCEAHEHGWRDEDGRKRGDTRRLRKNDDGSYSLIVEEVYSDAEVVAMFRKAGVEGRVESDLYRAVKVKGKREPHAKGALSLDRELMASGFTLADTLFEPEPGVYGLRPSMQLRAAFAFLARAVPGSFMHSLPIVVRGWLDDPIATAEALHDATIAIQQSITLNEGRRETAVLGIEAGDESGNEENQ